MRSKRRNDQGHGRRGGRRRATIAAAALALLIAGSLAAIALASSSSTVVSSGNTKLGKVAVNSQGRTLYVLSPETTHHLLCKSSECFKFWPPFTASSKAKLVASGGVKGSLGLFNRGKGVMQVTLNGEPLYFYAGDHGKGQANGQGIKSFGGTWHVITVSGGAHKSSSSSSAGSSAPSGSAGGESW
jgi:predicted lipoprotein with Yx(FWY)xxD motif